MAGQGHAIQTPDNVHKLRGTYRKDRHGDPAEKVEVPVSRPDPPDVVAKDEEATKEWGRICDEMETWGILAETDRALLAQYCLLWSEFCERGKDFPAHRHTQFRMVQQQLGITTITRCKLRKPKGKKGAYSDFA